MRIVSLVLAALLTCSSSQVAQAQQHRPSAVVNRTILYAGLKPASLMLPAPQRSEVRGRIAACANLAAVHALDAKARGADYPAQDRILDVAFLLCMSGQATAD